MQSCWIGMEKKNWQVNGVGEERLSLGIFWMLSSFWVEVIVSLVEDILVEEEVFY